MVRKSACRSPLLIAILLLSHVRPDLNDGRMFAVTSINSDKATVEECTLRLWAVVPSEVKL